MRPISFQFDLEKAIQTMAYLVEQLGSVEKVKLTKLLYIADRDHFLKYGYPITGDRQCAMRWGPVPSDCLRALDGEAEPDPDAAFRYVHVDDNVVMVRRRPDPGRLSDEERQTLDAVIAAHGHKDRWALVKETHEFPEYKEVYRPGTPAVIPYELILKHYGDESQFRHNRPVVSPAMATRMLCPFPESEPDL